MFAPRYFPHRYFPHRFFGNGGTGGGGIPPIPPPPGTNYQLLINAVERQPLYGWEISSVINGQSSLRFDVLSQDGSYRPGRDEEVFMYEDANLLFGGMVVQPFERGMLDEGWTPIITSVDALDFKVLTQRRFMNETIPAGTLKSFLQRAVLYLNGIALDAAQVNGPSLDEHTYVYVKLEDVLNEWTTFTGYVWDISFDRKLKMILPGSVAAPYNLLATNSIALGDVTVELILDNYANRVIARTSTLLSIANDAGEQAIRPVWEVVVTAPDTTDQIGLDALAAAYLSHSIVVPKKVRYKTFVRGLAPGQTQSVILPKRNVNNTFLIVEVRTRRADGQTIREVTALEGSTYQADWRDVYRQWSGGGTQVAGGTGGGIAVVNRFAYFLGGSGLDAARSSVPTWIPASGGGTIGQGAIHVQVDTVQRNTTDATIKARMRVLDSGNSVQARLYDVSAGAAVAGVSPVVTSTTWQTVSWNVTLNAGAHLYELQLLPGLVDQDVMATAYLE